MKDPLEGGSAGLLGLSMSRPWGQPANGDVVLVLGNYRASLTTARQLSALGCTVILGSEPNASCAEHSRFVDEVWDCPRFTPGSQEFLSALRNLLRRLKAPVTIMPVIERPMDTIASFEDDLVSQARLALPEARVLAILHDKYRSLVFAREAGLAIPPFAIAQDMDELVARTAEIGCPVVIRPVASGGRIAGQKAVTLHQPSDLSRAMPSWPTGLSSLLIQRRFVGRRTNVYFAASGGRIVSEQHALSLRTDRADGTGQTIEGITCDPIEPICRELKTLVRRLQYTGVGCAQFLYDEDRQLPCFLEINARFGASYAVVERTGMELTRFALHLAWNDPSPVPDRTDRYDKNTRFVWTLGDIYGLLRARRRGEVTGAQAAAWAWRIVLGALRARAHVTWSIRDPVPTLILYGRSMGSKLGLWKRRCRP